MDLLAIAKSAAGERDVLSLLDECVSLCSATGESWIRALASWKLGVERCKAGDLARSAHQRRPITPTPPPKHTKTARSRSLVARPSPTAEIVDLGIPREMTAPPEVRGV
jgi:hypothetical protein